MNPYEILLQSLDIIIEAKLWEDKKPSEIFKILMYVHNKGFLYTPLIDGKVIAVLCAYRIPEVNDENLVKLPIKESGKILYVPFALSLNKEDNIFRVVRESLNIYLEKNNDIEEIVLEDKNKKLKRYSLKTLQGV